MRAELTASQKKKTAPSAIWRKGYDNNQKPKPGENE